MNLRALDGIEYDLVAHDLDGNRDIYFLDGNDVKYHVLHLPKDEIDLARERGDLPLAPTYRDMFKYALSSRNLKLPSNDLYIVEVATKYQGNEWKAYFFDAQSAKDYMQKTEEDEFPEDYCYDWSIDVYKVDLATGKSTLSNSCF